MGGGGAVSMIEECESFGANGRVGSVSAASKGGLTRDDHRGFEHELKFEVQMYKVRDQEYVLDFQVRRVYFGRVGVRSQQFG